MSITATASPPRRAHAFINQSPETYEARMRAQSEVKKEAIPAPKARSPSGSAAHPQSDSDSGNMSDASLTPGDDSLASSDGHESARDHSSPTPSSSQASSENATQTSSSSQTSRELKDAPRKRRRTSPNELHILETEFSRNSKPCKEDRERIASLTSMDEKAVQVWFQNKRQSCRRQQNQGSTTTPALLRTHSMPAAFQDENSLKASAHPGGAPPKMGSFAQHMNSAGAPAPAAPASMQPTFSIAQPKGAKSLKLSMSADGKAELVERSPLKQLHSNSANIRNTASLAFSVSTAPPAMRFATMPVFTPPQLSGVERECASSLLVLKSGQWR